MFKAIRRVFISHTSEFAKYPEKKSFIDAAVAAVVRAGMVPCDMAYFSARDEKPAKYCEGQVRECEIYVGIIGFRYGSAVRDQPEFSYTELEFNAASSPPVLTRLVFLMDPAAQVPIGLFSDTKYSDRQKTFRKRLSDLGITCKLFTDVNELEMLIYQALSEIAGSRKDKSDQEHIQWPEDKSPYPGLLWFDKEYAPLFFGRDREVMEVIAKMSEPRGRFIIISGASGSGKSSLVGAGVWHALIQAERMPGSLNWLWCRIQPGDGKSPFEALAWGLKQTFQKIIGRPEDLAAEFASNTNKLSELLSRHTNKGQELVLFVDQLEELFTRGFDDEEVVAFLEQLVRVVDNTESRLRVFASLRSEFVTRLEESESIRSLLNAGYSYHVGPVSPRTLQDMIEKPAQATRYEFDPGLVGEILDDARQEPGHLPLVAYTLKRLFECREGRRFTRDSYLAMGKVAGAIATQAEQVLEGLQDPEVSKAFDWLFGELVHLERDRLPTRRRVALRELGTNTSMHKLIKALAAPDCRVLVTDADQTNPTVEVAHEKLFTAWPRLREWIDKEGDALRLIEHATEEARRWLERGSKAQDLWSAERAAEVSVALQRFGKKANTALDCFLQPQPVLIEKLHDNKLSHQQRGLIGRILAEFGDPRPGVGLTADGIPEIEWVDIPGGRVKPPKEVGAVFEVKRFRIARYPVTNIQFSAFVNAQDGYGKRIGSTKAATVGTISSRWKDQNHPCETVSWYRAVAFCRWLTQKYREKGLLEKDQQIRLPSEWEWQQAATSGNPKNVYPWGPNWDSKRCNNHDSGLGRTTAVGMYPKGVTVQGVSDMAGNVWEWCLNKYEKPNNPTATRVDESGGQRTLRGGSWANHGSENFRSSLRLKWHPDKSDGDLGFRPAWDLD